MYLTRGRLHMCDNVCTCVITCVHADFTLDAADCTLDVTDCTLDAGLTGQKPVCVCGCTLSCVS